MPAPVRFFHQGTRRSRSAVAVQHRLAYSVAARGPALFFFASRRVLGLECSVLANFTLAQRLLLATGTLTVAATTGLGYGVREAFRRTEERRFQAEFVAAREQVGAALEREFHALPALLGPHCAHDPLVDDALVGLTAGDLETRRLSLSLRLPELTKALDLDELWLITNQGEVLGAHRAGLVGQRDRALAARITSLGDAAGLSAGPERSIESACVRRDPRNPKRWVGLLARRRLEPMLARLGSVYGVALDLGPTALPLDAMRQSLQVPALNDQELTASRSRQPLLAALRELDVTLLSIVIGTVLLALLFAAWLSRGLARPMVELARQASEVMRGEPRAIVAHGPREIEESAAAFNRAIEDLVTLRQRLAQSERVAAWREIARTVAHEIKNPLLPIRAAMETLRRLRARNDPAFDDYFDEATRTALEEVNRINAIVSEFTQFARLPPPNPAPMDLGETVRSVVALHGDLGAELELVLAAHGELRADKNQVVQVLTNLLQNAVDAVRGEASPRVKLEVGPGRAGQLRVSVQDNGPGLAPEIREKLFQPYATTKAHGTGLGLAIAQRLVLEHGGEIGYQPLNPRGSEFWFELPLNGPVSLEPASHAES